MHKIKLQLMQQSTGNVVLQVITVEQKLMGKNYKTLRLELPPGDVLRQK